MKSVVVLQEYVPGYRVPFFQALIELGKGQGIKIDVAAGKPAGLQSKRGDTSASDFILPINQYEFKVLGRRLVARRIGAHIAFADMVVMEQARRNIDAYRLFLPRRKQTTALWGHGKDYVKSSSRLESFIQRSLTRRCDWFFAYTESGARAVEDQGVPAERITTVYNSVDTSALSASLAKLSEAELKRFRDVHGLTDNVAVFIGGLDASKRLPFLIESAKIVHATAPDFRLLIVGDGDQRQLVEQAAEQHDSLVYAGALFGSDKMLALAASKVIAMPGRVGLVAVDSFAIGRPIVTTDWPWHAPEFEYLTPDFDSVVTPNDLHAYAQGLLGILVNQSKLQELQSNCLEQATVFTVEAMAERFLEGIIRALNKGNS